MIVRKQKNQIYNFIMNKLIYKTWEYGDNKNNIRIHFVNRVFREKGDDSIIVDITIYTYLLFFHRIYFKSQHQDRLITLEATTVFSKLALVIFKKKMRMGRKRKDKQNQRLDHMINLIIESER